MLDALPQHKRESVRRALNAGFDTEDHGRAKRLGENPARSLEAQHPGAAASLCEGLEELLTVKRLRLGGSLLERTLSSVNGIENLLGPVLPSWIAEASEPLASRGERKVPDRR